MNWYVEFKREKMDKEYHSYSSRIHQNEIGSFSLLILIIS